HVAQQAKVVDLALLPGRARVVEGGLCRPSQLAFDVQDELLDLRGRRPGLLARDAHEGDLRLLIGEVEIDRAAREKDTADQEQKDDDILPEEPAALHRRSVSARRSILRGTVAPSSAAVFRFTARSILSAPSTGRSCGRVPRRIFATSRAAWMPWAW